MKRLTLLLTVLIALGLSGCMERPARNAGATTGTLLRVHFAGTVAIRQGADATQLKKILGLPETAPFRDYTLEKLARAPRQFWSKELPAGVNDESALIQPLLQDLVQNEWLLEVRGPVGKAEMVLAIQLNDQRAKVWNDHLSRLLNAWKLGSPTVLAGRGWEVKRPGTAQVFQFVRTGSWVLFGMGENTLRLLPPLADQGAKGQRVAPELKGRVLEVEANLPALGQWFPVLAKNALPPVKLTLTGRGDSLRTEMRFTYTEALPVKLDPWNVPTQFINDPLLSFTAIRGVAPLLSQVPLFRSLGLNPMPNQVYIWGMDSEQVQVFFAWPQPGATNALRPLALRLPNFATNLVERNLGNFMYVSNRAEWIWQGLPYVIPNVRTLQQGSESFLCAGLTPLLLRTSPPPAELFGQLKGGDNLVYYDWELTGGRLNHGRQFHQLHNMFNARQIPGTNVITEKWLVALTPHLGNTATEIRLTAPKELTLVRRSHLGLTGFELATLGRWIYSPGFPFKFEPPPPLQRPPPKPVTR